jgi:hypothetical protein
MNTLEQLRNGQLAGTRKLTLRCGLTGFPSEIFELADSLEILDLSGNELASLPDDLPRLTRLQVLFCSNNPFTELPEVLGRCPALTMVGFKANRIHTVPGDALPKGLRWLILTDNQIESLPTAIGQCTQLQKLMLAGNRLTALPLELAACTRLELLRISANRLTEFPRQLLALPRLSWLAFAGNPFCEADEVAARQHASDNPIAWHRLTLQHTLGEGASGVILQADLQTGDAVQPVAVKLFKGEVTSDGLPQSEMTACLRAGRHPHLIPVIGTVPNHPTGASAMVMTLMDPTNRNLAGPPSLDSCTRDVYADGTRFEVTTAIQIAQGIVSAARHLHERGITHGDLYAHNILVNPDGHSLLGDFGAASFFSLDDAPLAQALQAIEVRAVGCLLEELVARCKVVDGEENTLQAMTDLKIACLREDWLQRPRLAQVEHQLFHS